MLNRQSQKFDSGPSLALGSVADPLNTLPTWVNRPNLTAVNRTLRA